MSLLAREDDPPTERDELAGLERAAKAERVGVAEAVRRRPLLAALPALVLVLLALVYGFIRTPTYTAEAYQSIGRIDVNQPGALSGFQQATETLATTYSRAVRSTPVIETVSERTGLTPTEVRARLGAYPVPESAVFVVAAQGPSAESAINLATRGSRAVRGYIKDLNRENPNGDRLYDQFRRATYDRARLRDELDRMKIVYRRRSNGSLSGEQRRALARARSRVDAATLRRDVARRNYAASASGESMISVVQELALPETASSDRFEQLQILLFIALSVGVLLGLALATLRANGGLHRPAR